MNTFYIVIKKAYTRLYTKAFTRFGENVRASTVSQSYLKNRRKRQNKFADPDQQPKDPEYEFKSYFSPYIHRNLMSIIKICTLLECNRNE